MVYIDIDRLLNNAKKTVVIDINNNESKTLHQEKNVSKYILNFKGISNLSDLNTTKDGRNLVITKDKLRIVLTDYFSKDGKTTSSKFKTIRLNDTPSTDTALLDALTISSNWLSFSPNKKGVISGTVFSDTINAKNMLNTPLNSKNKGLTINSGRGNDTITGTSFNDTISGGVGTNTYNYDFGSVSGQDTIKLTKNETLKLNLKNGETILTASDLAYGKLKNDLIIFRKEDSDNITNQLLIQNFFKTTATVKIGDTKISDYLTSNEFEGLNIFGNGKINGTQFNDTIFGSAGNDTITAKSGNDVIYTNGGKDTIVETSEYGHDTIESGLSSKVTVKLSSFDANNLTYGENDLTYTTDENSSFTYSDFVTGESADLWIKSGSTTYHVQNNNSEIIDLSKDKNNNVLFLTADGQEYTSSKKKINVVYSFDGENKYTLQGGKDTVVDSGNDDDSYIATVSKSTKLLINDDGGNDSLNLKNKSSDLVLFYDIDNNGKTGDDLIIYNKKAVSYTALTNASKNKSFTGGVKLTNYFTTGEMENVSYIIGDKTTNIDILGWKYLLDTYIKDCFTLTDKKSIKDIFESGTKQVKSLVTNIFKSTTYSTYEDVVSKSSKYSDIKLANDDNVLNIYEEKDGEKKLLYAPISNFIGTDSKEIVNLIVLDDNGRLMTMNINSAMDLTYSLGNDNVVTFDSNEKYSDINFVNNENTLKIYGKDNTLLYTVNNFAGDNDSQKIILNVLDDNDKEMSISLNSLMNKEFNMGNDNTVSVTDNNINPITTIDGSKDTLIFNDKKYTDFYTTGTLSGAYSAGDPLIAKDGNDLKIGDITVKDIDGMKNEIQIVDMEGKTKNIIIGQGTINGTFESEIIVGSNSADTINTNGRNDLIYMGDGNDTLNLTSTTGEETGKNTAEMIGIGGTHSISNDLDIPAISVYDSKGDDTYNTTLKEFGLYIEDYAGNDTLNIKYSDDNLMYFFDVVNPNLANTNPTIYTDLMICDKSQFMGAGMSALSNSSGLSMKAMMESMQGSFGYAWIDDHFGNSQTIEEINIITDSGNTTKLDIDTAISSTKEKIEAWLTHQDKGTFNMFEVSGDFATAWDVIEKGTKADKLYLANLYMNN